MRANKKFSNFVYTHSKRLKCVVAVATVLYAKHASRKFILQGVAHLKLSGSIVASS